MVMSCMNSDGADDNEVMVWQFYGDELLTTLDDGDEDNEMVMIQ